MAAEKTPLSVAIITLNEEDRLADCLKSANFADDIVVVDSGSDDQTVAIAESFGARVFEEPWQGFGPQKQFAINKCLHEWILILDADERLPQETEAEIRAIIAEPVVCQAYSISRKNYFFGRWIRHAGWWPDRTVRLFRKGMAHMPPQRVHESLQVEGTVAEMRHPLIHFPFRDLRHMMLKMDQYSTAGAEGLFEARESASTSKAASRAGWALIYNYCFRGGFLDGGPGLIIAVSDAMNIFFKYAKLKEMNERKGKLRVESER